tara:strand:- start:2232 stop:3080 length:849 start_codon:yes stop_codon:yes gene_type:complete
MRTKALIVPQRKRGNITIVGSYRDNKTDKELFLLASGKKVVTSLLEQDRVFQHTFEEAFPYEFTFDSDQFAEVAVLDFWKNHPLIKTEGHSNPNMIAEQFHLVIKQEKTKVDFEELKKRLEVVGIISQMSYQEQYNLMFAIGGDPRDMEPMELYLALVGLNLNGLGVAKKAEVKRHISIQGLEKVATIYANKAIKYGIVTRDQSVYKIGGRNAGTSIDSVIALVCADADLFENYIKPEVEKLDNQEVTKFKEKEILDLPEEIKNLIPVSVMGEKKKVGRKVE